MERMNLSVPLMTTAFSALKERAEAEGKTPEEKASEMLSLALSQSELTVIRRELQRLRVDVATSVEALLTSAGKVTEENARKWVKEELLTR